MTDRWFIHPNRFGDPQRASATPFRVVGRAKERPADEQFACVARVPMAKRAGGRRDTKGRLDFDGDTWTEVAGSALMFARRRDPKAPRIGIKLPGRKHYSWWDGTTTAENLLVGEGAAQYVRVWLEHLFPGAAGRITVSGQ
ncbi:MAG: hypothetical protein PHQ28_06905 [Mycobacterium sp.]|nr:hypothetical protein [Mycobacterium sp.]